jgi:hypothetical protein
VNEVKETMWLQLMCCLNSSSSQFQRVRVTEIVDELRAGGLSQDVRLTEVEGVELTLVGGVEMFKLYLNY